MMANIYKGFTALKLTRQFLNALEDLGFSEPTPIQQRTIPLALAGHDILGIAQTGTGKTAAFILPVLMKIKYAQGQYPRALIVAPTRELSMQISEQVGLLTKYTDIRHTCVYGGIGPKKQIQAITAGIDLLVGTPGRIKDIYFREALVLKQINIMVLDEADKVMDMGFMPQIRDLLEILPVKRQNLLFSATMPLKVVSLSEEFLAFPERVEVAPQATPADRITQSVYFVPNFRTKIELLAFLITQEPRAFSRVIIFTRTRKTAENITRFLNRKIDSNTRTIHSNKSQNTRTNAMNLFKSGKLRFLVATDVAARGIDVKQVSHVISFDVPLIYEDYVHRIGRTARLQYGGTAITFCNPAEVYHLKKIEKLIAMKIPLADIPQAVTMAPTDFDEQQTVARAIDEQKRRENPDFKGAFHRKKQNKIKKTKGWRNKRKN